MEFKSREEIRSYAFTATKDGYDKEDQIIMCENLIDYLVSNMEKLDDDDKKIKNITLMQGKYTIILDTVNRFIHYEYTMRNEICGSISIDLSDSHALIDSLGNLYSDNRYLYILIVNAIRDILISNFDKFNEPEKEIRFREKDIIFHKHDNTYYVVSNIHVLSNVNRIVAIKLADYLLSDYYYCAEYSFNIDDDEIVNTGRRME